MHLICARNVNDAFQKAMKLLPTVAVARPSRAGPVLQATMPVTTMYEHPTEKVLMSAERDANPFFHMFEALWMLGGRSDVAYVRQFNGNVGQFSDDGVFFHGAYGRRWQHHFARRQLDMVIEELRSDPVSRRVVLQMWDPRVDLGNSGSKDLPCNLCVHFQINASGRLDQTVFCRSNDVVWGCYGSDAVTFSTLLEFMAAAVGVPAGRYWQVSDNWHGYVATVEKLLPLGNKAEYNPYSASGLGLSTVPLVSTPWRQWLRELEMFLDEGSRAAGYCDRFFRRVAVPMLDSWNHYKAKDFEGALRTIKRCRADDWQAACFAWLLRRKEKWTQKTSSTS